MTFIADDETLALIAELKPALGARTTAGVFRKSLALLRIATERSRSSGYVANISGANVLLASGSAKQDRSPEDV